MADLRLSGLSGLRGLTRRGTPAGGERPAVEPAWRRVAAAAAPAALWRSHRLFTILVLASLVPRVLASLSFRPALLTADSFLYMQGAVSGTLGRIRPFGYSLFLGVLQPLPHVLLAVTTVQHLMGIAIAAIVYGLLRHWGLPGWGAALAAAPTLFDTRQIALESYILPDTLYTLTIMVAVALLLTRRAPRLWRCLVAGLLLAYVALLRGNGLPIIVVAVAFMLVRRVGWRAVTAAVVAFCVPVLGYVFAYHASYGAYSITSSDGIFLWSRTTSFANCAVIKPPPQLRPLCPSRQMSVKTGPEPAWSVPAMLSRPAPTDYLWAPDVWWRHGAHPGVNSYNNKLGERFALDAIKAQPTGYLRAAAQNIMLVFLSNDRPQTHLTMTFTVQSHIARLPSYYAHDIREYAGTTENTHPVYPYAFFLFLYQLPVYFPGIVFFLVLMAGLVGAARKWREWGGPQALPWVLAAVSVVLPALLFQALYRYTMVAIPLACVAAGMAFIRGGRRPAVAGPAAARLSACAEPLPMRAAHPVPPDKAPGTSAC